MKTAIVLFNLGGPDSKENIPPFLFNFFMDANIIRAPVFVRWPLAKYIAWKRSRKEAGDSYKELGDRSPLLANTTAQADALEAYLNKQGNGEFKSFVSMRYWHPMAPEIVRKVADWKPDRVLLVPMYPQFSTTTTRSSFQSWEAALKSENLSFPTKVLCCYPWEDGFVAASARNIRDVYARAEQESGQKPRLLFSAHGLPEKIIEDGDPYQYQCEQSAQKIAAALEIPSLDWQICYQSRVGPLKWIGPSTEEALRMAATDKVPVVIYPHAFTQEHVETLVEIEIEYRELAEEMGLHHFYRVDTVGPSTSFIEGLAAQVLATLNEKERNVRSHEGGSVCPAEYSECCQRNKDLYPQIYGAKA